jgi:predicted dehydrogenase
MERLRAGVVGLRRGRSHVRVLQALGQAEGGVEVAAVADSDGAVVERVSREFGIPRGCSSLTELLDLGLDLVVLATPMPLHAAQAIEALEHGAHVMSEVPAVVDVAEAEALIAAVERSGKQYMMGENCCWWAVVDTARQLYRRGDFGRAFYAEAEYIHNLRHLVRDPDGAPTWRWGLAPITYSTHSLGPLLWITGAYPLEAVCYGSSGNFEPGRIDLQTALFRLTDGAVGRVTVSFANAHWGHHRYTLFGTQGSMDTGWVGRDEPRFQLPTLPNLPARVTLPIGTDRPHAPRGATAGGHGTAEWFMYRDFLQALRDGTRPPLDVYDSVMYSLPGMLAAQAAGSGRAVAIPQFQLRRPG